MAAEGRFRVDLEALACAAAQVSEQGEDLASAHLSSDNRITSVQSGWVGASAAVLSIKTATWLDTSRRLLARVGAHALDLNDDGIDFATMERDNVEMLRGYPHPGDDGPTRCRDFKADGGIRISFRLRYNRSRSAWQSRTAAGGGVGERVAVQNVV